MLNAARFEARKWIEDNPNEFCLATNRFASKESALLAVDLLYRAGCAKVEVGEVRDEDWRIAEEGGPYSATLFITFADGLPHPPTPEHPFTIAAVTELLAPDEEDALDGGNEERLWWD